MYDVIVVGAGPAGCIAAKRVAAAGYEVLLVEKMQMPRRKSCSGILIKKAIDIVEAEFGKIPDNVFCRPKETRGIIITNEQNQEFRFESKNFNIWRNIFDYWLALAAKDAGAEIKMSTSVLSCEEKQDHIVVKLYDKEIYYEKARIVIACDGAASAIKRNLLKVQKNYIITYQAFCRGVIDLDQDFFHAYLHPRFSEYDAWFNAKDEFLIFGVGVKEVNNINKYYSQFLAFLSSFYNARIQSQVNSECWLLPHIRPGFSIHLGAGSVLFAGEAANFLNPMGEGISCALVSGCAAAEAIKLTYARGKDVDKQALLSAYEKNVVKERQYMLRQWELLARISPKFSDFSTMDDIN